MILCISLKELFLRGLEIGRNLLFLLWWLESSVFLMEYSHHALDEYFHSFSRMTSQSMSCDGSSATEVVSVGNVWEYLGKVQEELLGIWLKMIECLGGRGRDLHLPFSCQTWCKNLYISGSYYIVMERNCFKGVNLCLIYLSGFAVVRNIIINTYNLKKLLPFLICNHGWHAQLGIGKRQYMMQ